MVFGNIKDLDDYKWLEEKIYKCLAFVKNHDMAEYSAGSYKPEGMTMNINEFMTDDVENRLWEAHRRYIDIHLVLEGTEQIDIAWADMLEAEEYSEEKDIQFLHGDKNASVVLGAGDFAVCYPKDIHRPGVAVNEKSEVKKAVFKVLA